MSGISAAASAAAAAAAAAALEQQQQQEAAAALAAQDKCKVLCVSPDEEMGFLMSLPPPCNVILQVRFLRHV